MHRQLAAAAALLLLAALPASAATVVLPDGTTSKLEESQEVTGPASVYAEGGQGRIQLHEGAALRFLGAKADDKGDVAEDFFLKSGSCDADMGHLARLATPAFWAFSDKGDNHVRCRFEVLGEKRAHARASVGSGVVRLMVSSAPHGITEAQVRAFQGVAIQRETSGLRFRTDFDNHPKTGLVRILVARPAGGPLDLYAPKATEGAVLAVGEGRMVVVNGISSWRGGEIRCSQAAEEDQMRLEVELGAGTAMAAKSEPNGFMDAKEPDVAAAAPLRVLPSAGVAKGDPLPLELPFKVLVKDLRPLVDQDTQRTTAAALWLENQGAARGPLPLEVAFAYAPPGAPTGYFIPCFVSLESPDLKEGGSWFTEVRPETGTCGATRPTTYDVRFVRLLALAGAESPAAAAAEGAPSEKRRGTLLLGGAVEVLEAKSDFAGPKPALSFTIRNVAPPFVPMPDEKDPFDPVGELRVRVRLYRDGQALDLGADFDAPRAIGALGVRGKELSFRIEVPAEKLAGAWPVLTLSR